MNKSIKLKTALQRGILFIVAAFCILTAYFAVKWYLANIFAVNTGYRDVAEYAVSLAPNDPRPHYTLAVLEERSFIADDLQKSLAEYEKAVSLSPNDYRLWLDLGRARDRNGDTPGAEKALRKSLELAPNYSRIHWTLGNILLREGATEEAFIEIRKAVENDSTYANPAVNTVWQVFNGDVTLISQKVGDSSQIKAALAIFLAKQKRFDEALALWKDLPETEKKTVYKENGQTLMQALLEAKRFRDALAVRSQIGDDAATGKTESGKFSNPGFEANVSATSAGIFDWKIDDALQPQIGFDDQQKHGGNRSLVILFNSATGKEFRNVQQTVAVDGNHHYNFETFARADLKTQATVRWEIIDAADEKVLASTTVVPNNADWMPLTADFTTMPTTQAIIVRLARAPCPDSICPISGKVWFDDFSLK